MEFLIDKITHEAILCGEDLSHDYIVQSYSCQVIPRVVVSNGVEYPVVAIQRWTQPLEDVAFHTIQEIVFPDTIKRLEEGSFCGDRFDIDTLELPDSLLVIGENVFCNRSYYDCGSKPCSRLTCSLERCTTGVRRVILGPNVVEVAEGSLSPEMEVECRSPFLVCTEGNNFRSVTFTDSCGVLLYMVVDPIRREAAVAGMVPTADEDSCEDITIPEVVTYNGVDYRVTTIKRRAFSEENTNMLCYNIAHLSLPRTLKTIEDEAFVDCLVGNYEIPMGVEYIGEDVFDHYIDRVVTLPVSVRYIGRGNDINTEIISNSPYVDIERQMMLDEDGHDMVSQVQFSHRLEDMIKNNEIELTAEQRYWYDNYGFIPGLKDDLDRYFSAYAECKSHFR